MWIHKIQNEQLSLYAPFIKIFYPKQLSYSARPLSCHGSYRLLEGLKLCGKSVGEVPLFLSQSFMECIFLTWHACIYTTKIYAVHLQIYIIHVLMISVQVFAICQVLSPFLRSQKKHVVIKNDKDKANVKPPPPPAWAVHPAAATLCPNLSYQTKRGTTVAWIAWAGQKFDSTSSYSSYLLIEDNSYMEEWGIKWIQIESQCICCYSSNCCPKITPHVLLIRKAPTSPSCKY